MSAPTKSHLPSLTWAQQASAVPAPPSKIFQVDLDHYISLGNRVHELKKIQEKSGQEILAAILAGAKVEHGVHTAEIETTMEGTVQVQRLVIR